MNNENITGGEAVCRVLRANGIDTVFGLLGGSMLELYDAIHRGDGVRYIGARDERAAGLMADGWARMRGQPGVVLGAQAGPGVVNLATAVACAHLAFTPLVVIAGSTSRADHGKDTFQEVEQVALFAPIAKRSVMVTERSRLAAAVSDAIRLAMSGRRGPVVLHIPRDLFAEVAPADDSGAVTVAAAGALRDDEVAAVTTMLAQSTAPVIIAGGGMKSARGSAAAVALAEQINAPVVTAAGHADVMPHRHPLNAGQGGPRGNNAADALTRDADLLLALGTRLGFNSTFHSHDYLSASAKIIQVNADAAALGRYFPVAHGFVADAADAALAVADAARAKKIDGEQWSAWREKFKHARDELHAVREHEAQNAATPLHPHRALAEIRAATPADAVTVLDTGNACLAAADRCAHHRCPSLLTPLDFGLVGFAYAAAIGVAAAGDRPVLAIVGDGGFGFQLSEINTAVAYNLPVVAVVLDNGAWGAEKAYQNAYFAGRVIGADIASPPLDEVARLCGARGYRAERPGDLADALTDAFHHRQPSVIHVPIDPDALTPLRKDLFATKK